jgi:hypothetical protein
MAREERTLGSALGTILVVEDEQAQRETLCAFLGEEYAMLEAGTARGVASRARPRHRPRVLDLARREDGLRS